MKNGEKTLFESWTMEHSPLVQGAHLLPSTTAFKEANIDWINIIKDLKAIKIFHAQTIWGL